MFQNSYTEKIEEEEKSIEYLAEAENDSSILKEEWMETEEISFIDNHVYVEQPLGHQMEDSTERPVERGIEPGGRSYGVEAGESNNSSDVKMKTFVVVKNNALWEKELN